MSWVSASEEECWLSELAEALRRGPHVVWVRWKSQHRKIVYLSLYVEKPFNSKVIKSFVPELRSRKCFLCFGNPILSMGVMDIMNVLHTGMNMSISHIHVGLCNILIVFFFLNRKAFCCLTIAKSMKLRVTDYTIYIYIYIYIYVSSRCAISTDISDPLSPNFSIAHCFRQVFMNTSHIGRELLYIGSIWSSYLTLLSDRGPHENIPYDFVLTSPVLSFMSSSSNFYSFRDRW